METKTKKESILYFYSINFILVECVIRKGIHFPKDEIQGLPQNQQLEDESSDSKTRRIKMQVLSLLKLSSCELNDLLQFISVSDLVFFLFHFYIG